MSSVTASGGVTDYLTQVNQLRNQANLQAARQQASVEKYTEAVADRVLANNLETIQRMLYAGEIEFKTGLIINTAA